MSRSVKSLGLINGWFLEVHGVATLGLAYAQAYLKVVIELILRGIFLGCKKEI